ncbi:ATP-binding protein [Candidatus Woesearchaeota archaeon]|nr:ATP-binding protein [Candidatus Woesearchaeota archaeon]
MFINRISEKQELKKILGRKSFEFAVFYGRRRIGKTRLILEVIKGYNALYFLAAENNNLQQFIATIARTVPEITALKEDWEIILNFLKDKIDVLVIDEFQNLIKDDHAVLSIFQRAIDTSLSSSKLKFIILGSSVSLITSEVLEYKSPLYGRKTYSQKIQAMSFFDIHGFFPHIEAKELMEIYGFADGIPYYLEKIKTPFWKWLDNELKQSSFLKDELTFILRYEFEDIRTYKAILEAIAHGKTKINEIKDYCRMQRTDVSPYLSKLINTEFVLREIPITESSLSKMGRYYIKDQFVSFWFRYISPNISNIESGIYDIREIKNDYQHYLGFVFEKVCKQFLIIQIKNKKIDYNKLGKWWRNEQEIDIIALNESKKEILLAECKWQENVNAAEIIDALQEKAKAVRWHNQERKEKYMIFAISFKNKNNFGTNVTLVDLKELQRV